MKRSLILFFLFMTCFSVYAQKNYVNVVAFFSSTSMTGDVYLSGDIPIGIDTKYSSSTSIGTILNMLSEKGFEVEFMCGMGGSSSSNRNVNYLLSKKTGSYNAVRSIQIGDEDVTEIARYNLQGIPVNENEKGIQIIVYSNYTTKTVIVQ